MDIINSIKKVLDDNEFKYDNIEIIETRTSTKRNIYITFYTGLNPNFSKIIKDTYYAKISIEEYFGNDPLAFETLTKESSELCITFSNENHSGITYSNQYNDIFNKNKNNSNKFNNVFVINFCRLSDLTSIKDMESIVFNGIDNSKKYGNPMYTIENIDEIESSLQKLKNLKYASLGIDSEMCDKLRTLFPTIVFV